MAKATEPDEELETVTVTSTDGTEIAYKRSGSGPPLILVHGSTSTHTAWERVRPGFANHFTVCAMDRRGHGESGDADEYALEREVEDVVAVIDSVEESPTLLGSNFGAIILMEAALQTETRALVLNEPSIPVADQEFPSDAELEVLTGLVEDGKNEQALVLFYNLGEQPVGIDELREWENWQNRVNEAHLIPREWEAIREYVFDPARLTDMTTPLLLLTGSESDAIFNDATAAADEALPNSRLVTFEGQGSAAYKSAPDSFIDEVLSFVRRST